MCLTRIEYESLMSHGIGEGPAGLTAGPAGSCGVCSISGTRRRQQAFSFQGESHLSRTQEGEEFSSSNKLLLSLKHKTAGNKNM